MARGGRAPADGGGRLLYLHRYLREAVDASAGKLPSELMNFLNMEAAPPPPKPAPENEMRRKMREIATQLGGFKGVANTGPPKGERENKFTVDAKSLRFGKPVENALGVEGYAEIALYISISRRGSHSVSARCTYDGGRFLAIRYMCVEKNHVMAGMIEGIPAIEREYAAYGTDEDKECLDYVLHKAAGESDARFQGGLLRDRGPNGEVLPERTVDDGTGRRRGMRLADFVAHPNCQISHLTPAHVAALRLYSTAAYQSINNPLRDKERFERHEPHRLPVTVAFLADAVKLLRAVDAEAETRNDTIELYRGMRDVSVPRDFMANGGTELAPMSTTFNLAVAMQYSASTSAVLLRLRTDNFLMRGADITFLSAFPGERECLFPPLTYLAPTEETEVITIDDATFHIVDVRPQM